MLLVFQFFLLLQNDLSCTKYKYTLSINPIALFPIAAGHGGGILLPSPGFNFEIKVAKALSLNFELNNALLILPVEVEVGLREYLKLCGFKGFYFYQGIGWGILNIYAYYSEGKCKVCLYLPGIILAGGYKYVAKSGFTIDPLIGAKLVYRLFGPGLDAFIPIPIVGLYLGYTW